MRNLTHQQKIQKLLDQLAIMFSGLCILHCLLTPIFVVIFPVLVTTSIATEEFHQLLLWLILPTSLFALFLGSFNHKDRLLLTLGLASLSQLIIVAFLGHESLSEPGEGLITIVGSVALILGHIRNRHLCCHKACTS